MSFVLSCQFSTSYWYQIITFQLINFPFRITWKTSLQCFLTKCYFCCNIYKTNYIVWFEHVLIEDDRMYVQIWWNFIFCLSRKYVFYLVYILRKEFVRCESVKSQICRACSDLTKLADGWKWCLSSKMAKYKQLLHFNIVLVVSDGPMSGVNNVVSWNIYVQNIYNVACKIIMQTKK